jgi:hypothetical protein
MVSTKELNSKNSSWTLEKPPEKAPVDIGVDCYMGAVAWLAKKVRRAPALKLPGLDVQPHVQIVHDRWISFRQKLDGNGQDVLLRIEILFYREAKYHGKHYEIWLRCKDGKYTVVALEFKGVVLEDQIALFPILGTDAIDLKNQQWAPPLGMP